MKSILPSKHYFAIGILAFGLFTGLLSSSDIYYLLLKKAFIFSSFTPVVETYLLVVGALSFSLHILLFLKEQNRLFSNQIHSMVPQYGSTNRGLFYNHLKPINQYFYYEKTTLI